MLHPDLSVTRLGLLAVIVATAQHVDVAAAASQPSSAAVLTSCQLPDLARPARCGVIEVPENPNLPQGRRLAISVAVIPADAVPALADPIVVLMGGREKTRSAEHHCSLSNSRRCAGTATSC